MNTPQWERAKEIFDAALDLEPEQRANYLLRECDDDTTLRHEVESLLKADADAGSFLNPNWLAPFAPFSAPAPQPDFQLVPGDIVSGRFKIVRPIGDGGMGRVYEAHDSVLGVQVALKTLRPEISSNPEVLFRFRQEVRIAHRITHPNVCRTFHLDHELRQTGPDETSSIDLTFLTMEFLQGETLQQHLKHTGRIARAQALLIAQQMAEAIEAAHNIGIIHRDIKPSNVMICPSRSGTEHDARVVITDFGLAKFEANAQNNDITSISQPGRAMGTLSYMSPEQLQGAEVGPATDIYAFGLVLYEMVTGVKAFPHANTMAEAWRRISEPPPSPRDIVPELPAAWETAILGCLQINPTARFQQASEVIAILDGTTPHSSRLRTLQRQKPAQFKLSRGKVVAIVLTPILLMALFFAAFRFYSARTDATVAPGTLVYLAPVKNETGEKQLDNVTELVRAGLEQSAHINLLDSSRAGDILQQMAKPTDATIDQPTAREIAMRAGAARVVFITLTGAVGNYRMSVEIQRPDSNDILRYRNHWTHTFTWQNQPSSNSGSIPTELLMNIRDASSWIRLTVGESSEDIGRLDSPPEDVTTDSWSALSAYASAEQFHRAGQTDNAILELQHAVQFDPHFALAYARMGDLATSLSRIEEGYRDYELALSTDMDRRLTRRELDRIRGIYANDSWDYQAAENTFRDYTVFYPNDYLGWWYRGLPLVKLNRFAEANAVLRKAYAIDPQRSNAPYDLAIFAVQNGNFDEAERWIAVLQSLHRQDAVSRMRGVLDFLSGHYDDAHDAFHQTTLSQTPSIRLRGDSFLARLAMERADIPMAMQWTETAIAEAAAQGNHSRQAMFLVDLARLKCAQSEYKDGINDTHKAIALDTSPPTIIAVSQLYGDILPILPSVLSIEVRKDLSTLETKSQSNPNRVSSQLSAAIVRIELLLADEQWDKAVIEARHSTALDMQYVRHPSLVRALRAAADHASTEAPRLALLGEARSLLAKTACHPNILWSQPEFEPPGALTADIQAFLEVSKQMHREDGDVSQATHVLHTLQPSSSVHAN